MTVSEFENIMRTARRGAEDAECVSDKLIFLLRAMELVEHIADDIADDIALLPKNKLNDRCCELAKRINYSTYCDKFDVLFNAVQRRVMEESLNA